MEIVSHQRQEKMSPTNPDNSAPLTSTPGDLHRGSFFRRRVKRVSSVFRRVSSEWNCVLLKIKLATQVTYSDVEALDSLFKSSTDDDIFERIPRPKKGCNHLSTTDVQFLEAYKQYDLLEEYHRKHINEMHPLASSSKSSLFACPPQTVNLRPYQALDILLSQEEIGLQTNTQISGVPLLLDLLKTEELARKRYYAQDGNLGNALWEIRRARWLTADNNGGNEDNGEGDEFDVEAKVALRAAALPVKEISRDLYSRIYRDFVEKAKPLKPGKRINLEDMMVLINAGRVHQRVWESVAKGLGQ